MGIMKKSEIVCYQLEDKFLHPTCTDAYESSIVLTDDDLKTLVGDDSILTCDGCNKIIFGNGIDEVETSTKTDEVKPAPAAKKAAAKKAAPKSSAKKKDDPDFPIGSTVKYIGSKVGFKKTGEVKGYVASWNAIKVLLPDGTTKPFARKALEIV